MANRRDLRRKESYAPLFVLQYGITNKSRLRVYIRGIQKPIIANN
jgi:hypothetical protein